MASGLGLKRGRKQAEEKSPSLSDKAAQRRDDEEDYKLGYGLQIDEEQIAMIKQAQDSAAPTETATTTTHGAITKPVNTKEKTKMSEDTTSIMEFSEDLSTAEAPPPLPVGEYPARIVKSETKVSKAGNKYLALVWLVEPESYPADFEEGNPEGETFQFNRVTLIDTPLGRYRLRRFNEAVGAPNTRHIDPNDYMDLTATITITHSMWEGDMRAECAKVTMA